MCSSDVPAPPTPDPRIAQYAGDAVNLGKDYLDFAKNQFAATQPIVQNITDASKKVQDFLTSAGT